MNRFVYDPIVALNDMLEECRIECNRVLDISSSGNACNYDIDIAYDTYWGVDHRFVGALSFALVTGCIDSTTWINFWDDLKKLHKLLLEK